MEKNPEIETMRLTSVAEAMGWKPYSRTLDDKGNMILSFRLVVRKEESAEPTEMQAEQAIPS